MKNIENSYTLFTRIPIYFDGCRILTTPLWEKDLSLHFDYLSNMNLCCPVQPISTAPTDVIELTGLSQNQVFALRQDFGHFSVLKNIIPNFKVVHNAAKKSEIVHSGGAGWAFPLSFYLLLISLFVRFKWVMVIESSFWMKPSVGRATLRQWSQHYIYSFLLRQCLKKADARIFTTDSYRRFFGLSKERCLIAPAVWVDQNKIITQAELDTQLATSSKDEVRLVFPSRLVSDKGVDTIISGIEGLEKLLPQDAPSVFIDLMGEGPDAETCRNFASEHKGKVAVCFLKPVSYETEFLPFLRKYHAVLIANRKHEQPRIVFDAFSQGLPVISSRTNGVVETVKENDNALLFNIGDANGLASCMAQFVQDAELRTKMARRSFNAAQGLSHAGMHQARRAFFDETILRT